MDMRGSDFHNPGQMRFRRLASGLGIGVSLSACLPDDARQRLDAGAVVVDATGAPLAGAEIEAYVVYFEVADGFEIERRFVEDVTEPAGIRTDEAGRFLVAASDLALSYDWQRDEQVCEDLCSEWQTSCQEVTEEVCVERCEEVTYDDCSQECWDDCETVCYDQTVCDEEGNCWSETVCEDQCTSTCEEVCGPVTEYDCYDECRVETYEECSDVCLEMVQECRWVTRTYTSYPELSEVVATRSELILRDADSQVHVTVGETLESRQGQKCDDERCEPLNVWIQQDRFVVPFAP